MEAEEHQLVAKLQNGYRQMVPVAKLRPLLEKLTSYDQQVHVYDQVIRDPIVMRFPPSAKYSQRVLKVFVELIESTGQEEVYDPILDHLLSLGIYTSSATANAPQMLDEAAIELLNDPAMREISFRTYPLPNNKNVTVRLAEQLDQVGLTTWEAGLYLAEFVAAHSWIFTGKECLELGSGIGFTGVVLAKLGDCKRVILTDYTDPVMRNLNLNINLNTADDDEMCPCDAIELDWENDPVEQLGSNPDIILAADVVYDIDAVRALCKVLKKLLAESPDRFAIVATTRRNPATLAFFLEELTRLGIKQEDITAEYQVPQIFEYTRTTLLLSRLSIPVEGEEEEEEQVNE